jgi:Rps23 Pro-64 3,4-dihydroxylase Tpa1-like proline 4-hydroxylase|tara:strand:- start:192 stop:689 length:498 start_codon:yes stop_codon:yes gene_type:complete
MEKVKYISNVLPEKLILEIKNYAMHNSKKAVWNSNRLLWAEQIVRDSGNVDILNLKQSYLEEKILFYFKKYTKFNCIGLNYNRWYPGSFIPFHNDQIYKLASTLYLNEEWHRDYGGLFLYEHKDQLQAIVPKYNNAVINSNKVVHGTSIVSPKAPIRETLQLFFK